MKRRITKETIKPEEVGKFKNALYEVKTITPLVENPIKRTYILTQAELTQMLKEYETYGEFLISIKVIGGNGIA
ncbi:hypothetical protein [Halothermothrix orenii]|uniref:Uncharacterized protein n=1 Tax=Halothermothrix orenii (strain H 168 / OCM 544 / DSM 9562) TaxID=373903 RepID=B8D1N7_HALOH|nr:hypothetical protein [Halothermothrix orenii]ACL69114.1 hypothetical protein Hore_03530 [Halothermothrix orenii H 168]